jgi:hypothetical protein
MKKADKKVVAKAAQEDAVLSAVTAPVLSKKAARIHYKERVENLMRKGLTKSQAKEVVDNVVSTKEGLMPGMMIQFHDMGLRVGYIADVPSNGQVKVQPMGPKGAELPSTKYVKLENVVAVDETISKGANTMANIKAKATEITQSEATKKAAQAAKLVENLKKAQPAAAKEAATTPKATKAPKAEKPAVKATKATKAPATKAAKKEPKAEQTWKFVKVGPATGQRGLILEVLQSLGGTATRSKLESAFAKKLDSSQEAGTVLSLKKKFLLDNGCVKIS